MPENLQIPMKKKDTTIACGVSPCCGTLTYKEGHGCYERGDPRRFCGTRPEVFKNDDIYHTGSVRDSIHQDHMTVAAKTATQTCFKIIRISERNIFFL